MHIKYMGAPDYSLGQIELSPVSGASTAASRKPA